MILLILARCACLLGFHDDEILIADQWITLECGRCGRVTKGWTLPILPRRRRR